MNILSIGISKYEAFNDSIASDNDAKLIHQFFKNLYPRDIIDEVFLYSEEVNKQKFQNAMTSFNAYNVQNNHEFIVFYYSGHAKNYNNNLLLVLSDGIDSSTYRAITSLIFL